MKSKRQAKILEIIARSDIETQEQLLSALQKEGFACTQATISRDIKDLRIVKEQSSAGVYRYTSGVGEEESTFFNRLNTIFKECVISFDSAQNIIIIRTMPGLASAAASAIDAMHSNSIVGSLAGDDTVLIVMRDNDAAASFCREIRKQIN